MERSELESFIDSNMSMNDIASKLNIGLTTVRYWFNKFGLKTKFEQFKPGCQNQSSKKWLLNNSGGSEYCCRYCGEKDEHKFMKNGKSRNHTRCKKCHSGFSSKRFRKLKIEFVEYKGGKCEKCGYNECVGALDFHHIDPEKKDAEWKRFKGRSLNSVKAELDKCMLLCANCHRAMHWKYDDKILAGL